VITWRRKRWEHMGATRRSGATRGRACIQGRRSAARMAAPSATDPVRPAGAAASSLPGRSLPAVRAAAACAALLALVTLASPAAATPESEVAAHTWASIRTAHVYVLTDANPD